MYSMSKAQRRLVLALALLIGSATAASATTANSCWLYNGNCCEGGGSHFCYTGCGPGSGEYSTVLAAAGCGGHN